jgi:hypothetical protein
MKLQPRSRRVQTLATRLLSGPAYRWGDLSDPRARRGRRWPCLSELVNAAFLGLLAGCATLREVEGMTDDMGPAGRKYVSRRVPDTTLWALLPRLSVPELRAKLQNQVRAAWRSKSLRPVGLPCGLVVIDGKGIGALEHDAHGTAQKAHRAHDGTPYWLARMLRAVLTSAEAAPCIDQMPIGAKTNEIGCVGAFFDGLMVAYGAGDLFEIVSVDAGIVSLAFAGQIHEANKAYVMAIKGNQPELLAEAKRLLDPRQDPDAVTDWEPYKGKQIQRRLYRTAEMAGYHDWSHLRQTWLVVQETRHPDGNVDIERRYFVTSVPSGRLSPAQILTVVRRHWGVENDCFWTLDMQWAEDSVPWCSSGRAVEVVSWLRLMAYNFLQAARRQHLRPRLPDGKRAGLAPWRRIFAWVRQAWQLELLPIGEPACG